jgi:hypothetical protein
LHQLPEDILDVTKIESKTLDLKKERFNLNDVILNALDDKVLTTQFNDTNIQIIYQPQDRNVVKRALIIQGQAKCKCRSFTTSIIFSPYSTSMCFYDSLRNIQP